MVNGTVKMLNKKRGFGFIEISHNRDLIFFKTEDAMDDIKVKDEVEFDIELRENLKMAINISYARQNISYTSPKNQLDSHLERKLVSQVKKASETP